MGGKGKHRTFADDNSDKDKVRNQSRRIKELEKEIKRLKAELKTLNTAFNKSAAFMSDEAKLLTVPELITAADKNQTLKDAKTQWLDQAEEAKRLKEETRQKWKKWAEENRKIAPEGDCD